MSIIDPQLVNIEITPLTGDRASRLRLNYQGQIYDLVRAFANDKRERAEQQLAQLMAIDRDLGTFTDRYLLVGEVGYFSLWELDRSIPNISNLERQAELKNDLALQQASIWLFQELWLQWQDLLGARQLQAFADNLLKVTPQLGSGVDIDRLLSLDPLAPTKLGSWSELDFITFDRQLYQLTQKKLGQQFGTKLTIEIIQAMPDSWQSILTNILDI